MNNYNPYNNNYTPYTQTNGITWVQGIEGAKAWRLQPNSNILLMDSESEKFYIKVSDNVGMCTLRIFEYKELTEKPTQNIDMSNYITRDELNKIINELKGGVVNE